MISDSAACTVHSKYSTNNWHVGVFSTYFTNKTPRFLVCIETLSSLLTWIMHQALTLHWQYWQSKDWGAHSVKGQIIHLEKVDKKHTSCLFIISCGVIECDKNMCGAKCFKWVFATTIVEKVATDEWIILSILHHYHNNHCPMQWQYNLQIQPRHDVHIQSMQNPTWTMYVLWCSQKSVLCTVTIADTIHAMQAWCCQGLTGHWLSPYCIPLDTWTQHTWTQIGTG